MQRGLNAFVNAITKSTIYVEHKQINTKWVNHLMLSHCSGRDVTCHSIIWVMGEIINKQNSMHSLHRKALMIKWPAVCPFAHIHPQHMSLSFSRLSHLFFFSTVALLFPSALPFSLWFCDWGIYVFKNGCQRKGTSGFNTDSLFWLMLHESATHCRHKRIQLHALWFIKTSKETLSPFIDLPGAFSCLSTWSWQMDRNSFPCK